MERKKRGIGIVELVFGVIVLLAVGGIAPLFSMDKVLGSNKPVVIIGSSLAVLGSFAILSIYHQAQKRRLNQRYSLKQSLFDWMASSAPSGAGPKTGSAPSRQTVANIAAYQYRSSGYRLETGRPENPLRLVNPKGQPELVYCQSGAQPVGLREVVAFYEMLRTENANRGEIWSVGGFTSEAAHWVRRKPIQLLIQAPSMPW